MMKPCLLCGENFEVRGPRHYYCSRKCTCKAAYDKNPAKYRKHKEKWNQSERGKKVKRAWYDEHKQSIFAANLSKPDYMEQQKYSKRARKVLKACRPKMCEKCGETQGIIDAHHITKPRSNNDISNLMWLCRSCHARTHVHLRASTPTSA